MQDEECWVPVKRLGGGYYLFGLKKIFAKIINDKLVVRVGGGYMNFKEFIETHTDQEIARILSYMEREKVEHYEELSAYWKYVETSMGGYSSQGSSPSK